MSNAADFAPVRTDALIALSPLKADVYIRLSEEKFLKLFRAGDVFTREDLVRWRDTKHIGDLWLRKEEISAFLEHAAREIEKKTASGATPETSRQSFISVHQTIQDLSEQMGVTPEMEKVTKAQVANTISSLQLQWKMSAILKQLRTAGGYTAAHSFALSYLACLIANQTQWGSEYSSAKLCYAAFLHDLTLKNDKLARIGSIKELEERAEEFKPEEIQGYKLHTIRAAEKCRQFKDMPHDVDQIVQQHHERPDGSGFPRGLRAHQVTPLAAVLIVAHELINHALKTGEEVAMADFVNSRPDLHEGIFGEVLESIAHEL